MKPIRGRVLDLEGKHNAYLKSDVITKVST